MARDFTAAVSPSLLFSSSPSFLPSFLRLGSIHKNNYAEKKETRLLPPRPRPRHAALIQPLHFEIRSAVKKSRQLLIVTGSKQARSVPCCMKALPSLVYRSATLETRSVAYLEVKSPPARAPRVVCGGIRCAISRGGGGGEGGEAQQCHARVSRKLKSSDYSKDSNMEY